MDARKLKQDLQKGFHIDSNNLDRRYLVPRDPRQILLSLGGYSNDGTNGVGPTATIESYDYSVKKWISVSIQYLTKHKVLSTER